MGQGEKKVAAEDIEKDRGKIKGTQEEIKRKITGKGRGCDWQQKESEDSVCLALHSSALLRRL